MDRLCLPMSYARLDSNPQNDKPMTGFDVVCRASIVDVHP